MLVTLRQLGGDELFEHLGGFGQFDRSGRLVSGAEAAATAAIGEGDMISLAGRLDCGVVYLVGTAFPEMEGSGLDGGGCWNHWMMGVVCGVVDSLCFGGKSMMPPRRDSP